MSASTRTITSGPRRASVAPRRTASTSWSTRLPTWSSRIHSRRAISEALNSLLLRLRERSEFSASLIARREWIRLDQVGSLVDQLVLAVRLGATDARLGPEVMVLVDADIAFRRALELDPGRCRRDLVDVERAGLLRGQLPQPRAEIGSLCDVSDHGLLAPHLLERGHEGLVVGIVERLEVLHAGIGARDVLAADAVDLVLRHRDGEQRLLGEIDADRLELLVEGNVGAADDDGVDHIGLGQLDLVDHRVELGVTEREIFLADHLAALQMGLDVLARDLVGGARPDVVGAEQIERLRALGLVDPVEARDDLLRRFLAGVDDVLGLLEA